MRAPRRWTPWRRGVQVVIAVFYLTLPWLNHLGWRWVCGNLASLKVGPLELVEPAAGLSALLAAGRLLPILLLGMALPVLVALVLGPVFCSWVCPWGLFSELLDRVRFRLVRPRQGWSPDGFRQVFFWRMGLLLFFLLASWALAAPLVAILAPPRLVAALPQELFYLRYGPTITGALLFLWLVLELVLPRRFLCRALCPVGGVWNFLRTPKTLAVRYQPSLCVDPNVAPCHLHCPWGIDPRRMGPFDGCTNCFRCVEGCPTGALDLGFGRGPKP